MTEIGSVLDGKYEILKEIGRGGMSIVYLAMDKHLNKQWAVKEIKKKGNGKNDEVVVNSLLAEANLMKRLDHPTLPRIVDIIDTGVTIYVVMDYIEGESLDKILNEYGAQSEETVIGWAKQICDALGYLHSQKPPIIYRDMKPANVMLKPEGNIKIIDFGIAREYKELSLADTTVLGTKGYAPPEQYSGQTDARSDIYALGMTMHHLLTGVDPRKGDAYVPVRQWNPELSEGIELIIDKCVEPAAENRYQSCADLLYDLEHPDLITKGYKKKQKMRLLSFLISAGMAVLMLVLGIAFNVAAKVVNNNNYDMHINSSNINEYYEAIEIYPERPEAYNALVEYCKKMETENQEEKNNAILKIRNTVEKHSAVLDLTDPDVADMYYDVGKLFFSDYNGSLKYRAVQAGKYFGASVGKDINADNKETDADKQSTPIAETADFDKKEIADCYFLICKFMKNQSTTSENSLDDFKAFFDDIESAIATVDKAVDGEANYDKISLYYVTMLVINDQAKYMASVGFNKQEALDLLESLNNKSLSINSTLKYVTELQDTIKKDYPYYRDKIIGEYNEVEKRQNGGN